MEVTMVSIFKIQTKLVHKKIEFSVALSLTTNSIFDSAVFEKYVVKIKLKENIFTPMNSSRVAIVDATYRNPSLTIQSHNSREQLDDSAAK